MIDPRDLGLPPNFGYVKEALVNHGKCEEVVDGLTDLQRAFLEKLGLLRNRSGGILTINHN